MERKAIPISQMMEHVDNVREYYFLRIRSVFSTQNECMAISVCIAYSVGVFHQLVSFVRLRKQHGSCIPLPCQAI